MKLDTEFYKLPLRFDLEQLEQEISQFSDEDWTSHSIKIAGEAAIILVSVGGTLNNDFAISGDFQPTPFLERCPYLQQLMAALNAPIARSYLIRFTGATEASIYNYHSFRHLAVHVAIATHPTVEFFCNGKSLHLAAGEAGTFDNSQPHWIVNKTEQHCIHLVIETKGSLAFESMLVPVPEGEPIHILDIPYSPDHHGEISFEPYSFEVLTSKEICELTALILADIENSSIPQNELLKLVESIEEYRNRWEKTFSQFGHHRRGELAYQDLIMRFEQQIVSVANKWLPQSGKSRNAIQVINSMLLTSNPPPKASGKQLLLAKKKLPSKPKFDGEDFQPPEFEKPIFIVSAPRAGSTLLFETLSQFPDLWTIGDESHEIIEGIPELHPAARNFSSNRLTEVDATYHICATLRERFTQYLQNREGQGYLSLPINERPLKVRFLEKTPKNALRIPFLQTLFPDALFIYLYREPKENISSLMEGWRSQRFPSYKPLPGWPYKQWSFLLTPGWSSLQDSSVAQIAASQWKSANSYILDDLKAIPPASWRLIHYSDLVAQPKKIIGEIAQFTGLHPDEKIEQIVSQSLPIARRTLSAPSPDKWRKNEREIATVLPSLEPIINLVEKGKL